jgi:hypothetical protein
MLRLVLDWFATTGHQGHPLSFQSGARWDSEALLPSQFLARHRGYPLAESWTHADGVVGHFLLRPGRGDLSLKPGARQLVVTEAKMFSGLSVRTTRAKDFDQAATQDSNPNLTCQPARCAWLRGCRARLPIAAAHGGGIDGIRLPSSFVMNPLLAALCGPRLLTSFFTSFTHSTVPLIQ